MMKKSSCLDKKKMPQLTLPVRSEVSVPTTQDGAVPGAQSKSLLQIESRDPSRPASSFPEVRPHFGGLSCRKTF